MTATTSSFRLPLTVLAASVLLAACAAHADLVGYWPLDGDAAAVLGPAGTLYNGPTVAADRNGAAGGALSFAATSSTSGSYVAIPGGGGFDGEVNRTISFWVKWDSAGQDDSHPAVPLNGAVLSRQQNNVWSKTLVGLTTPDPDTANIRWRGAYPTHDTSQLTSPSAPGVGAWHHIAVTTTRDWNTFYVDGVGVAQAHVIEIFPDSNAVPLSLGAWIGDGASYANATMDDVAVWDRELSPAQIAALAAQTATPTATARPIGPVSAQASTQLISGFNRWASNVVDGVGHTANTPDGWPGDSRGMWLNNGTFRSPNDTDPEIAFDLGGVHTLDSLVLYNYNEYYPNRPDLLNRGLQSAEVLVSTDNVTYTSLGTQTFARGTADATNPGQEVALGGVTARYVKLDNLTSHGGDNAFVGLNEVEFYGSAQERMPIRDVSVQATSGLFQGNFDRRDLHAIDGTGLFADGHTILPDTSMWLSDGIGFGAAGDDPNPELIFDLGAKYRSLESTRVWNYNETLPGRPELIGRGVDQMEVLASSDGVNYQSLGTVSLAQAPGVDNVDFSELVALGGSGVRFVKFDILSNHNGVSYPASAGAPDAAFVGLSEVRFFGSYTQPGLVNPSFEADGDFPTFPGYITGNQPITAWAALCPNPSTVRLGVNNATQPFANNGTIPDGTHVGFIQSYAPDGSGPRSLSQNVPGFQPGHNYLVTYRENARGGNTPVAQVELGGTTVVGPHTVTSVGGANPYRYVGSAIFTATQNAHALVLSNVATTWDTTLLVDDIGIHETHLLFADNFNVQTNSFTINPGPNDEPGRQSGGPLTYTERVGTYDYETQVDNGQYPDALLIANAPGHSIISVSPDKNFTLTHPTDGAHFVLQYEVDPCNPAGGSVIDPTDWAAVIFGSSTQTPHVNQSDGVGFLIRENGGFQVFDGTSGANVLRAQGDLAALGIDTSDWYDVRVNYFVEAFDDLSPVLVGISVDGIPIAGFQTNSGFVNNLIAFEGYGSPNLTTHGFDNFQVWSTYVPEPATLSLLGLGLLALARRRRRRA